MKRLIKTAEIISAALLLALSLLIFVQVLLRNLADRGFVWSEEMARLLLLTTVLIMGPVVFYRDEHVSLQFLSSRIPPLYRKIHTACLYLLILFFYVFYIFSHFNFTRQMGNVTTPSLLLPNSIFFIGGIIGAGLGSVVGVAKLINLFYKKGVTEE